MIERKVGEIQKGAVLFTLLSSYTHFDNSETRKARRCVEVIFQRGPKGKQQTVSFLLRRRRRGEGLSRKSLRRVLFVVRRRNAGRVSSGLICLGEKLFTCTLTTSSSTLRQLKHLLRFRTNERLNRSGTCHLSSIIPTGPVAIYLKVQLSLSNE